MAAYRIACKRNKLVQETQTNCGMSSDPAAEVHSLLSLQNHVLERIFVRLHLTDLARCCQVNKALQSLVQQEGVWQSLCADAFPNFSTAELSKWIIPNPLPESQYSFQSPTQLLSQTSKGPQTYRQLYPVLKQLQTLIGIWWHDKKSDKPALYVFDWGYRCVEGRKLCYDVLGQEPFAEPFQQVGPGLNASVQHVDSMHCLLTVQTSTPRSPITKAVQAATAVAVGGIPIPKREQADAIMGTSPEGSFEFEMQRFMQGHIANKQSKRRRSGHRSSSGTLPVVHTLTRVEKPIPTHRHPLAGLWRSTGMLPTCIMTVRYNFSLRAASIVATQVMNHSSLLHRWAVRAAPIAKPWLPDHVAMLTRQAELSLLSGDFDHLDDDGGTPLPAKEVVQIFQGEVVTSRLAEPTVLPSHLWLYADGTFGVIFDTWDHEVLVNMKRIDEDLHLQ
ncbi:TPA: F-box only protein 31 [Trebouxia sp. C0005]